MHPLTGSRRRALTAALLALMASILACSGCRFFSALPFGQAQATATPTPPLLDEPTVTPQLVATNTPPATEPPPGESFSDDPNDAYFCSSNEVVDDPAVEILDMWYEVHEDGVYVFLRVGQTADSGYADFSYSLNVLLGNMSSVYQSAIAEIHDGVETYGLLDEANELIPGSEEHILIMDDYVRFDFPGFVLTPGDEMQAATFHLPSATDEVRCDVAGPFELAGTQDGVDSDSSQFPSGEFQVNATFTNGSGSCMPNPADFSVPLVVVFPGDGTVMIIQTGAHENFGFLGAGGETNACSKEECYNVVVNPDGSFEGTYDYFTPDGVCTWDAQAQ